MIKDRQVQGVVQSVVGEFDDGLHDPFFEVRLDHYDRLVFHWVWAFYYMGVGAYSPQNLRVSYFCMTWASGRWTFRAAKNVDASPRQEDEARLDMSSFWRRGGDVLKHFQFWRDLRQAYNHLHTQPAYVSEEISHCMWGSGATLWSVDRLLTREDLVYVENLFDAPPR